MSNTDVLKEGMDLWNKLEGLVKEQNPDLSSEEQYRLTSLAMKRVIGLEEE